MAHDHCCSGKVSAPSVCQTLDELEFERGIWTAALNGETEKVKEHLSKGVNPDLTDSSGYSPLHYSSRNGHLAVCRILLEHGANPNLATKSGSSTALHRSAMRGHVDIVKLLLKKGSDPKIKDNDDKTALHKAAENGQVEVCKILTQACPGSNHIADKKDKRPADYVSPNNEQLLSLLK